MNILGNPPELFPQGWMERTVPMEFERKRKAERNSTVKWLYSILLRDIFQRNDINFNTRDHAERYQRLTNSRATWLKMIPYHVDGDASLVAEEFCKDYLKDIYGEDNVIIRA
jgi:hypothetical protein